MRKFTFLIVAITCLHLSGQAQKIGKIKSKAKRNSNNRRSSDRSSSSGSSGSSGSGSDFNGAACFDLLGSCFNLLGAISSSSSSSSESQTSTYSPSYAPPSTPANPPTQDNTTEKKPKQNNPNQPVEKKQSDFVELKFDEPKIPTVFVEPVKKEPGTYFQVKASYGFVPTNYEVFRPGARVRFGKKHGFGMAIDYRYNFLTEKILGERTSYFTHDIQLLQFAPETEGDVEIRVGVGVMVDEFSEVYPEFLLGFNALADDTKWNFGSEVRIANDFGNSVVPRMEWGSHVQYALVNQPKFKLYGGLRTKVANYFGEGIWSIGLGLTMRVY